MRTKPTKAEQAAQAAVWDRPRVPVDPAERPVYWFWVTDAECEALRRGEVLPSVQASAVTLLQWKGEAPEADPAVREETR